MAKVADPASVTSNPLNCGGGTLKVNSGVRRKTPSELRGELLRRKNAIVLVDESLDPPHGFTNDTSGVNQGIKKPDIPRNPRYIETRMDEVYPAKKSRLRIFPGKENAKEGTSAEQAGSLKNITLISNLAARRKDHAKCPETSMDSAGVSRDGAMHTHSTVEKCSQNVFRTVTEISSRGERSPGFATVDMDKALKGLISREPPAMLSAASPEKWNPSSANLGSFCSECHIAGQKAPLDLTLKTSVRVICSSSMNWFHKLMTCGAYYSTPQFFSEFGFCEDKNFSQNSGAMKFINPVKLKALHSWVYPQSSLPSSLISTLTLSAVDGVEMDFLRKRQDAWEDAFRSLYYMFRKNVCDIFYVCTSHFVVMFTSGNIDGLWSSSRRSCNAYISQSTRVLRSLLKEQDVCFSMPLCNSKVEEVAAEDLVELSEIEKHNLGQTRRKNSLSNVDNSPQSLLAFCGNENVQGLYDFLLNYRSFLTFLGGMDVPILYSPTPFQNASLSAPEIRYVETRSADHIAASSKGSDMKVAASFQGCSAGLCCSLEIRDTYLPPWIISGICAAACSTGTSFEASFTTEPTSVGLNVALEAACKSPDPQVAAEGGLGDSNNSFGIPETIVTPEMYLGSLKGLKYSCGSYTASLSPV